MIPSDSNPHANKRYLCCLIAASLFGFGCRAFDPDYAYISTSELTTHLVLDSPSVERLLDRDDLISGKDWPHHTDQERLRGYQYVQEHVEEFRAERHVLLAAMANQPGFTVEGRQSFRLLRESSASCEPSGQSSSSIFILVRVSTGPSKGAEGWACTKDVAPTGENVL